MKRLPGVANGTASLVARVFLGAVFLYLGWNKAADPTGFLKLVREFNLVGNFTALNVTAAVLPWLELWCGALLVLGIRPRATALVTLALLTVFTTAIALRSWSIYRGGNLPFCAISFDCGCGSGEVVICAKLRDNLGLLLLAFAVLSFPSGRLALWPDPVGR